MFPSLGYIAELERAAARGERETQSDVTVSDMAVRQAARRAFPDSNEITLHDDPIVGDGGLSYVFSIQNRESKYVLKVAPEEGADRLQKGAATYRYLDERTRVPVPAVQAVHTANSGLGYPYTIVEYIPGDELSSIQQFKSFPRERKKAILRAIGRTLGRLHEQTRFETYGPISARSDRDLTVNGDCTDWRTHYCRTYENHASSAGDSPVADLATRAFEFFERASNDVGHDPAPSLLHADFTPDNLIFMDDTVQAVLDWEHASAGSSAKEFCEVEENVVHIFQTEEVRRDLRTALHDGYTDAISVPKTFFGLKSLFAVGECTAIGGVYSLLSDLKSEFDTEEFRERAERELSARITEAESYLQDQ